MIMSEVSPRFHSSEITSDMSRSAPRVRWNPSIVDQSSKSRSNSSGWIGYDISIRWRKLSLAPAGNDLVVPVHLLERG